LILSGSSLNFINWVIQWCCFTTVFKCVAMNSSFRWKYLN
jgi:hypothetical protein